MTAKYNQKKRLLTVICKMALATRDVTMTPSINVLKDSTATDCGKMCAHATAPACESARADGAPGCAHYQRRCKLVAPW